jgi:hypothetical protein
MMETNALPILVTLRPENAQVPQPTVMTKMHALQIPAALILVFAFIIRSYATIKTLAPEILAILFLENASTLILLLK